MSRQTGTYSELIWENHADHTAINTTASEAGIIQGNATQPSFDRRFFEKRGTSIRVEASGIIGTTGTPTILFTVRLGTTQGLTQYGGTAVGVSAAITTINNSSNDYWRLLLDMTCTTRGLGAGNTTLRCDGYVFSPQAFAAPYTYPLEPTTPDTATWTATINDDVPQYMNLTCTWGTSDASNTLICKSCKVWGWN